MRKGKWLLGLAVLGTALWGGYWFVGATALRQGVAQALAAPRAPLRAQDHSVRGFPNRFDLTLTEPRLTDGPLRWSAPFVQIFALSYRPHHVIAVFPPQQRLDVAGLTALITARDARASAVMRPTERLALDRAALVAEAPGLEIDGARHSADALRLALRPGADGRYEAVAEVEAAFPAPALLAGLDPAGVWPRRFDLLRLEGELRFDRPLDIDAFRGPPPRLVTSALTGLRIAFEGVDLQATGRVEPGPGDLPEGELALTIDGWRELARRLTLAGILTPEATAWVEFAAPGLARPEAPEIIDLPLRLEGGFLRLGPLVLAELPRL